MMTMTPPDSKLVGQKERTDEQLDEGSNSPTTIKN